jgi:phosphomannomutase
LQDQSEKDHDSSFIYSQINDPVDGQIAKEITKVADLPSAPECMPMELARAMGRLQYLDNDMIQQYIDTICASVSPFDVETAAISDNTEQRRGFRIAYTPLHGVGAVIAERLLHQRGFTNVWTVKEQREPDGDFPTVEFPSGWQGEGDKKYDDG